MPVATQPPATPAEFETLIRTTFVLLDGDAAVRQAVRSTCDLLRSLGYGAGADAFEDAVANTDLYPAD